MTESKPTAAEHEALRARVSALSAASLRISASLDLETVLNEVVDSARALTGARFGAIATIDETGAPQDFVTSGFTEEEHRRLAEWPDGPRLFEHFRDLPGPVRIADVPAYVQRARLPHRPAAVEDLPGHADAPSRRACRQLLSRREGGRGRVHRPGRGDPGAVRLAGPRPRSPMRAPTAPSGAPAPILRR